MQQFFVNYKVTTARQLRFCKGGTMDRVNDRTAISYVLPENAYEYIFQHYGVKVHKDCLSYALQRTNSMIQFIVICVSQDHIQVAWLTYSSDLCVYIFLFRDIARWWTITVLSVFVILCVSYLSNAEVRKYTKQTTW